MIWSNLQDKMKHTEIQTRVQDLLPPPGAVAASGEGPRMGKNRMELTFVIDPVFHWNLFAVMYSISQINNKGTLGLSFKRGIYNF